MYNNKYNYCNNCGRYGHSYKKCTEAITSLGIISFKIDFENLNKDLNLNLTKEKFLLNFNDTNIIKENTKNINNIENSFKIKKYIKFLLISRKSSLGFIEFMRGHYDLNSIKSIQLLYKQMYYEEIELIKKKSFCDLWKIIWQINIIDKNEKEYNFSKQKYDKLVEKNFLQYCNDNIKPDYKNHEWGFPKGRRSNMEKNIDCAMREFNEETNLLNSNYLVINNIEPFIEELIGTNNIYYKHIYYIAICDNNIKVSINKNNKLQLKEVGDIKWLSYDESSNLIRSYHKNKIIILNNLFIFLANLILKNNNL